MAQSFIFSLFSSFTRGLMFLKCPAIFTLTTIEKAFVSPQKQEAKVFHNKDHKNILRREMSFDAVRGHK